MPATVYYAAMSLDGYIAEPEEELEWLTGFEGQGYAGERAEPAESSYPTFMESVGSLAMGSKTYEFILGLEAWPYEDMPVWVYTRRELPRIEAATGLRFTSGDVAELHGEMLDAAGGKDLWLVGGGRLASQYVRAGLLDAVRLTVVPVVLGEGLPLFAEAVPAMRLLGTTEFTSGMVELRYELGH